MSNILDRLNPTKQKKEVMLLNPDDNRFIDIPVERETESLIYCKKWQGILYRFFKLGPGWTGKLVRFLAVEGYPLISYITGKDDEGNDIKAEVGLVEFLKIIWTEKGYNGLPQALKDLALDPPIGTIVTVKPFIPNEKTQAIFDEVKAESVLYDADLDNLAKLGVAKDVEKWHDKLFDKVPWIMTGFGINYILVALGVF